MFNNSEGCFKYNKKTVITFFLIGKVRPIMSLESFYNSKTGYKKSNFWTSGIWETGLEDQNGKTE